MDRRQRHFAAYMVQWTSVVVSTNDLIDDAGRDAETEAVNQARAFAVLIHLPLSFWRR
jgi:hypothetical protein